MDINNSSSVDPEDIEIIYNRNRDSANYSLSNMSDLENDAAPWTPESPHPSMRSGQQPTASPFAPLGGGKPTPQHDHVGGQSTGGACAYPGTSVQESPKITSGGASYHPRMDEAVPDDRDEFKRDPKPESYEAVIICHPAEREIVESLQKKLNGLILYDGEPAKVAMEEDNPDRGKQEIQYFVDWLERAEIMLIYASESFCTDVGCNFREGIAIVQSFFVDYGKREFVIPIFLENKYKARYITPSMRAIKGIDYFGCAWTDRIANKFKANLDIARRRLLEKKKERELEAGVSGMKLKD